MGDIVDVNFGARNAADAASGIAVDRVIIVRGSDSRYRLTFRLQ